MKTAKVLTQSSSKGIPFEILRAYGIGDEIINIWKGFLWRLSSADPRKGNR